MTVHTHTLRTGAGLICGNQGDALMALHDLAMNKDPRIACSGRAGKIILAAVDQWIDAEHDRHTEGHDLLLAACSMAVSILATTAGTVLRPEAIPAMTGILTKTFLASFTEAMELHTKATTKEPETNSDGYTQKQQAQ